MEKATDDTIMIFIVIGLLVFEAIKDLLSLFHKGIMKDRRQVLMSKTNAELRSMLNGMNKISKLNKKQLVEMVIAYC